MKVNIRYTVDLEEVLQEMSNLYYKSLDKLETSLNIYEHFLRGGFNEMEVDHIITALEHGIKSYHDHQTKVSEILNILKGYQGIKNDAESQDTSQEPDA
tara:strand:+ start:190 stop:486 length:297 start_codon:yes stop_codon:yes gene_type:complete